MHPAPGSSGDGAPSGSNGSLKRQVTGFLLYVFILGDVLGAGIYALIGEISSTVGGLTWLPLLVALGLASLTAASYAELVTKYPRAGGSAFFAQKAFRSPTVSFLVGFCMLAAGVVSAAGLSLAFAGDYLSVFLDVPPVAAALVFLAVVALVNTWGIKESLRANVIMTAVELSGLLLVVVLVAVMLGGGHGDPGRPFSYDSDQSMATAVLGAAILAYYSFVGFETSANVVEEVRNPAKVYPRALFGALATAGVVYVLVGVASSIAVPAADLADSTGPLLTVVQATGVALPDWIFSLIALIAVANGALLTMIMASRLGYGMAKERLLPAAMTRVLRGRGTPWVAIIVTTIAAMLLTLTGDVAALAETVVLLLLLVFISTNVAVLVLRRDKVDHAHFRVWTVLPWLGVASCVLLLTQQSASTWLRAGLLLVLGLVIHLVLRLTARRGAGRRESGRTTS